MVLSVAWATAPAGFARAAEYTLVPTAAISQIFNDNVFGTTSNRQADTITFLSPGVSLAGQGPVVRQRLTYNPFWEIFWRNSNERSFSHQGSYVGKFELSPRTSLDVQERASYSPTTTTETFPQSAAEPQLIRVRTFRTSTEITPSFRMTETSQLDLKSRFYLQRYEQSLAQATSIGRASDTVQVGESAVSDIRLNERDQVTPSLAVDYFWFSGNPGTLSLGGNFGWLRQWKPAWQTALTAGVLELIQPEAHRKSTDITGTVSAQYQHEPWNLRFAYSRGVLAGGGFGSALIQDTVTLGTSLAVGRDWNFHIDSGYFHSSSSLQSGGVSLNGAFVDAGIQWQLERWLSSSLSYNFRIQESGGGVGASFYRNTAALTLSVIYPTPQSGT